MIDSYGSEKKLRERDQYFVNQLYELNVKYRVRVLSTMV